MLRNLYDCSKYNPVSIVQNCFSSLLNDTWSGKESGDE